MKLINSKKETLVKVAVGNNVRLEMNYFDGRTTLTTTKKAKVIKVNKVTFDAETTNGNVYRVRLDDPNFKLVK